MNKVNGKIESLQGLRAILIFLIFVVHTSMIGNISSNNVIYKYLASGGEEFGVHGLLLWVCPFAGWRIVEVTRDYKEKDRSVALADL